MTSPKDLGRLDDDNRRRRTTGDGEGGSGIDLTSKHSSTLKPSRKCACGEAALFDGEGLETEISRYWDVGCNDGGLFKFVCFGG